MGEALRKGATVTEIAKNNTSTFIKYHSGIEKARFLLMQESAMEYRKLKISVYYGPTGVGKTRRAIEEARASGEDFFVLQCGDAGTLWWDGYIGQKILIMDEFQGNWCRYKALLGFLDGNPTRLKIKGSHTWACWTRVYITCSEGPAFWYKSRQENSELMRRINANGGTVEHMDHVNNLGTRGGEREREEGTLGSSPMSQSGGNTNPTLGCAGVPRAPIFSPPAPAAPLYNGVFGRAPESLFTMATQRAPPTVEAPDTPVAVPLARTQRIGGGEGVARLPRILTMGQQGMEVAADPATPSGFIDEVDDSLFCPEWVLSGDDSDNDPNSSIWE